VVFWRIPRRIAEQSNASRVGADRHVDDPAAERRAHRTLDHTIRIWFEAPRDVCMCVELCSRSVIALRARQHQRSTAGVLERHMFSGKLLRRDRLRRNALNPFRVTQSGQTYSGPTSCGKWSRTTVGHAAANACAPRSNHASRVFNEGRIVRFLVISRGCGKPPLGSCRPVPSQSRLDRGAGFDRPNETLVGHILLDFSV